MEYVQVSQIKEKVEEKEGIPPVQQRLIYGGKQMYAFQLFTFEARAVPRYPATNSTSAPNTNKGTQG